MSAHGSALIPIHNKSNIVVNKSHHKQSNNIELIHVPDNLLELVGTKCASIFMGPDEELEQFWLKHKKQIDGFLSSVGNNNSNNNDMNNIQWKTQKERFAYMMNTFGSTSFSMELFERLWNHSKPRLSAPSSWFFDKKDMPSRFCGKDVTYAEEAEYIVHEKKSIDIDQYTKEDVWVPLKEKGIPTSLTHSLRMYLKVMTLQKKGKTHFNNPINKLTLLLKKHYEVTSNDKAIKEDPFYKLSKLYFEEYPKKRMLKRIIMAKHLRQWLGQQNHIKIKAKLPNDKQEEEDNKRNSKAEGYIGNFF